MGRYNYVIWRKAKGETQEQIPIGCDTLTIEPSGALTCWLHVGEGANLRSVLILALGHGEWETAAFSIPKKDGEA